MKKIFGGLNITWIRLIIFAIIIGISVGLLNSVPFLRDTTVSDIATYFDFWILCGILIIMNSKSNKESALKCFVFFLISQPLIYLVEVPFSHLGWQLFNYYKYWFIWTILTIPMGYIGYYMKKNKWYSLFILIPMLVLLSTSIESSLGGLIYSFPHHLINLIFVLTTLIIYPLFIFDNKKLRILGLFISIVLILFFGTKTLLFKPVYETDIICGNSNLYFDNNYKVSLLDSKFGELSIRYEENIKEYCIHAKFVKTGDTKVIIEDPNGNKNEYDLYIGKYKYDFKYDEEKSDEFVSNIKITINNKEYSATLEDNDTARKLVSMLPLELVLDELNGNEKYIYLANGFPTNPYKPKHINKGDIMLFDNSCIVIFYKSFDTPLTYSKIGHIDNLDDLGKDSVTVKFEK